MAENVYFPLNGPEQFMKYTELDDYHLLEFNIAPDNRFTPDTCPAILEALTYIQNERKPKPLVTSSTTPKFYSNGLDLERAMSTPGFFDTYYYPVMRAVIEFPWPTIAHVNGHAFAAGFTFAAAHDYIVMNPNKGYMCMNEIEFGAPLPAPMLSVFRVKYGFAVARKIALTAHRFSGKEALEAGLVNKLGAVPEVEEIVGQVAKFANAPSYGAIRKELFREVISDSLAYNQEVERLAQQADRENDFYGKIIDSYKSKL